MAVRRTTQRVTRWAGWSRRLGAFALMLLVVAGLAHRSGLIETPAFMTVFVFDAVVALLALACAAAAFARLWNRGDPVGRDIAAGMAAALIALTPALVSAVRYLVEPALVDIATDTADPPMLPVTTAERGPGANAIGAISPLQAVMQVDAYPAITGHRYELAFAQAVAVVEEAMTKAGWTIGKRIDGQGETTVGAVARSLLFAMPADVAVRITDEDGTAFVDMRSASSRFGWHDLGDNAARITAFYLALDSLAATRPPPAPPQESDPQ